MSPPLTGWIGPTPTFPALVSQLDRSRQEYRNYLERMDLVPVKMQCMQLGHLDSRKIDGEEVLIWGGTDGFCYGYPIETKADEDGYELFLPKWKVDCNEKSYRVDQSGKRFLMQLHLVQVN